jgi:AbrB family looped-hinge helix DNA binding protein
MKMQAKITSKGRITVRVKVRRAPGVRAGDKLLFEQDGDDFHIRPVKA